MKRVGTFVRLELPDLIRMNRLVRGSIDQAGFAAWSTELAEDERRALIDMLIAYAGEAGVDEALWAKAAALAKDDPGRGQWSDLHAVRSDLGGAPASELPRWLRWAVTLFGLAEGRVVAIETPATCNHWWHRDLTSPRVVASLLADPEFWSTSMKTDL